MKTTHENTLTESELKFLEENFNKRTTLKVALRQLEEIQLKFLKEKATQLIEKNPDVFNKISDTKPNKHCIYITLRIKRDGKFGKLFKELEFGIIYWEGFRCDEWYGFCPYAGIYPNKKDLSVEVLEFFIKNVNLNIKDNIDEHVWEDENGILIVLPDNWLPNAKINYLINYAKNLNQLSEQLNKLCEEVIRLMKKYSNKHK